MTIQETADLVYRILGARPYWLPRDKEGNYLEVVIDNIIQIWSVALANYPYELMELAFVRILVTDTEGKEITPARLIASAQEFAKPDDSEQKIVDMIRKAVADSNYHATERFEKLPPEVQEAVGSASNLQEYAQKDVNDFETVIMSQILRSYRGVINRKKRDSKVPESLKAQGARALAQSTLKQLETK